MGSMDVHGLMWLVGGPIMVIGLVILYRALLRDPEAKKRRCSNCWYVMEGVPGLQCPECGRAWTDERQLHRRKRRWIMAVIGMVMLAGGYAAGSWPQWRHGWRGVVPTTLLLWTDIATNLDEAQSGISGGNYPFREPSFWAEELWARYERGDLAQWQQRWLMRRDLEACIVTRDRWVAGEPLLVSIADAWFQASDRARTVTVRIKDTDKEAIWNIPSRSAVAAAVPAPPVPRVPNTPMTTTRTRSKTTRPVGATGPRPVQRDTIRVVLAAPTDTQWTDLEIELTEIDDTVQPAVQRLVDRQIIRKPISLAADAGEILAVDANPDVANALRDSLRVDITGSNTGAECVTFLGSSPRTSVATGDPTLLAYMGTGAMVDFLHDGQTIASCVMSPLNWIADTEDMTGDVQRVLNADLGDQAWSVRVTARPASSLQQFHATKAWSGSFTGLASEFVRSVNGKPVMPLPTDDEATALLRKALYLRVGEDGRCSVMLRSNHSGYSYPSDRIPPNRHRPVPELADLALGMTIEFLHGETIVASTRCVPKNEESVYSNPKMEGSPLKLLRVDWNDPSWIVRVTSNAEMSARDTKARRAWKGAFNAPAEEIMMYQKRPGP